MKKKLHIYCRVSSDKQTKGYSLEAQKLEGTKKAKQLDLTPVYYEERGRSADNDTTLNRPEVQRLLKECKNNNVSFIFCTELDRFTRRISLMLDVEKMFVEKNIIIYTNSSTLDLNNSEQRFVAFLGSLLGERENRLKTERSIRGMERAARKGVWVGIMTPYGYAKENKKLIIDDEEAEIYKKMVDMAINDNVGTANIAKKLNEMGVLTRGRKVLVNGTHTVNKHTQEKRHIPNNELLFAAGTIYCILTNPIYYGQRRWKGEFINAPAIIDKKTWDKLQQKLKTRRNYANKKNQHKYLLKGFLRCGVCGENLYGRIKPDERYYMCSSKRKKSCGLRSPNLDRLNDLVIQQILQSDVHLNHVLKSLAKGIEEKSNSREKELELLERRISDIRRRSDRLVELYELDRIDISTYDERRKEHSDGLTEALSQLEKFKHSDEIYALNKKTSKEHSKTIASVRKKIDKMSFEEKRAIVEEVIEEIIIKWDDQVQTHIIWIFFRIGDVRYRADSSTTPAHLPHPFSFTKIHRIEDGRLILC